MQLLFSFDQGMRVEKTLMQTLASQLSSTLTNSSLTTVISQRVFLFRLKRKSALDEIMKVREMFISLPVKTFFDLILFLDCCLDRKRKRRKQKKKIYGKKIG